MSAPLPRTSNLELRAAHELCWPLVSALLIAGYEAPPGELHAMCAVVAAVALRDAVEQLECAGDSGLLEADDVLELASRYADAADTLGGVA